MNPQTANAVTDSNSAPPHCQYRTASGRRCRMAVSDPHSGLCHKHAAERQVDRFAVAHNKDLDQADLAAALIGDIEEFRSAADINHSLGELYKLQARNKITPRRAAVMAYTANLLLRTLPAIYAEEGAAQDDGPMVIPDLPRPAYEESSGPSSQTPDTEASQPICRT